LGSAPPRALSRSCKGTGEAARSTDVCVPTGELTGAVAHARGREDALALEAAIVAMPAPATTTCWSCSILPTTARRGGTCTGEYVIGLGKIDHLEQEHGDLLPHLARLKASFDPNGILNPGKLLRTSD
jgi:D-lactate dehydrogenase (cytochrome)